MIDFVLSKELAKLGKDFGFENAFFIELIDAKNIDDLKKKISNTKDLVAVKANENFSREIFENNRIDIVVGLENANEKDNLHYRKSGLDHVLCNLAKKNNISVGFSFFDVLHAKDKANIMGRMMQNAMLCRKYKVNVVIASFASDKYDMRLKNDLEAFGRVIGIDKFDNTKVFKLKENKLLR